MSYKDWATKDVRELETEILEELRQNNRILSTMLAAFLLKMSKEEQKAVESIVQSLKDEGVVR